MLRRYVDRCVELIDEALLRFDAVEIADAAEQGPAWLSTNHELRLLG